MISAPKAHNESVRLASLRALDVLDSQPEAQFDALVHAAALMVGVPISLISLVDADRQWFKANLGLEGATETPRDLAFCAHAILQDEVFEIPDARQDERFFDHPAVIGEPSVRFYAGAPIRLGDGSNIGTLCVIDREARQLSERQRQALRLLATAAAHALDARRVERALKDERQRLAHIIEGTHAGTWEWNLQTGERLLNARWLEMLGYAADDFSDHGGDLWNRLVHPDDLAQANAQLQRHLRGEIDAYESEVRLRHRDGQWIWVMNRGRIASYTASGEPEKMFGTHIDISERKLQEDALRKSQVFLSRTGAAAGVGGWEIDLDSGEVTWSEETRRIHGVSESYRPELRTAIAFYAPEARALIDETIARGIREGGSWDLELPFIRANGERIWVRAVGAAELENGRARRLVGALQDVTEARRVKDELAEQHELLRVTLQSIGDSVITTDAQGQVAWLNPIAERMTGWPVGEAIGRPLDEVFNIVDEDKRHPVESPVAACLRHGQTVGLADHTLLISRNGEEYGIEDSAAPIRNAGGEVLGVVLVFHDVTEQRRLSGEMSYRATHDALTGLVNRAEFESRLRRTLERAREDGGQHALMYVDLDRFKLVNDACGHSVGDQLLQQVSKLFTDSTRTRDTLARLGGDEFGIILEHCTAEQALRVGQKICDRMDDFRFVHDGRRFRLGTSIGLVPLDSRWANTAAVTQAADTACYAAKENGRNRVHLWSDTDLAMRARHGEMQWASRIEQALDENRFVLFAQRIQALGTEPRGIYAEALLRMVAADGTLIPPGAFLPAAERFHLASRIDRWVLRRAIDWLKALPELELMATLSINLSGQSIGDRAFHRHAIEMLKEAGPTICSRVCLEITETAAVTNMMDAALFVEQVRSFGIKVALDDFGAGASSFGYLKTLAVDYLKIDGQFIQDLMDDPLDEAAVACFVQVAKLTGVKTVAEFVDRPEILRKLGQMGVDFAQGFLVHRGESIDELMAIAA